MFGGILGEVAGLLLPRACVLCGGSIGPFESGNGLGAHLCEGCAGEFSPLPVFRCTVCSLPFSGQGVPHPCPSCLKKPPSFERLHCWGVFGSGLKEAVHSFKYKAQLPLQRLLEELSLCVLRENFSETTFEGVVPVPCHRAGLAARGFDLPALLARRLARELKADFRPSALKKTQSGKRLAGLSLAERKKAVRGLYDVNEGLSGRVLLVDDVATSLATIRLCARKCREAGATRVYALALARAAVDFRV